MARRFLRGRRRFGRRRRLPTKWTGQGLDGENSLAAGVSNVHELVVPADYRGGQIAAAVEAGAANLVRIILHVNLRATVAGGVAFMYLIKHGFNEPTFAATDPLTITSGDILWQDHYMVPSGGLTHHIEADIPSNRRLENDRVVFVITATAQALQYSFNARVLMRTAA